MLPDNRKPPAGTGGVSEDDLLTGGITTKDTDSESVAIAVEAAAIATVMSCPDNRQALIVTEGLAAESFIVAEHRSVWLAITAALEDGQPPHPVVVATAIQQLGIDVPPTWHGTLTSRLFAVAADPAPVAMARWLVEQVIEQANRRRIQEIGRSITGLAPRGQYGEMLTGLRQHLDILQALVEVTG